MRNFSGTTEEAGGMILGAGFWKPGLILKGIFTRSFPTSVGECYEFLAMSPARIKVVVDAAGKLADLENGDRDTTGDKEKELDKFSVGALAGFKMALDSMLAKGFKGFEYRDQVTIECTGTQPAIEYGQNPMPLFRVIVDRP